VHLLVCELRSFRSARCKDKNIILCSLNSATGTISIYEATEVTKHRKYLPLGPHIGQL